MSETERLKALIVKWRATNKTIQSHNLAFLECANELEAALTAKRCLTCDEPVDDLKYDICSKCDV